MRRPPKFYNLSRPKIRQSWNKWNFYNIARGVGREPPIVGQPTFFQQKWRAKSKTRAYHGEHIPEKKWTRLFSRRLQSAVEMPPDYLAANDGSEQALGTGSGLGHSSLTAESYSRLPGVSTKERRNIFMPRPPFAEINKLLSEPFSRMTPHVQMVYAPLERRLDTAIFRALFASSVRQARQFIIHGSVKVNGKKMVHPSYLLNPGDMFQVDVERVLYATGQQKIPQIAERVQKSFQARQKKEEEYEQNIAGNTANGETAEEGEVAASENPEAAEAAEGEAAAVSEVEPLSPEEDWVKTNRTLKYLLKDVKRLLNSEGKKELSAKEKKDLRFFRMSAKRFLSHPQNSNVDPKELIDDLTLQMRNHETMRQSFEKFKVSDDATPEAESTETTESTGTPKNPKLISKVFKDLNEQQKEKAMRIMGESQLSKQEMRNLGRLLKFEEENPVDNTKPYATPWRPRPYMAPFVFIPRYLEVNPRICAAVYLRHPVARKGIAEVPTPFSYLTSQLTHNYYLERG